MSESDQTQFPFWSEDWMKAQQGYWEAWSSLSGMEKQANNPWAQAMDQWKQIVLPGMEPDTGQFMNRLVDQGKAFMQVSDTFNQFFKGLSELNKATDNWQEVLRTQFDGLKSNFFGNPMSTLQTGNGVSAFWTQPLDAWQRSVSSASPMPGDFLQATQQPAWGMFKDQLHDGMEQFLSVPGVGPDREKKERWQAFARAGLEYQRALEEYMGAHNRLGTDALERLQQKVTEKVEKDDPITSLRGIYDLWVDCCEEAYADFVFTEEYAEIYARMVNALMALKQQNRNIVDKSLSAAGMPTMKGFDTLQRRQQELRREIVKLKVPKKSSETQGLEASVVALQKDLAGLKKKDSKEVQAAKDELASLRKELNALKTDLKSDPGDAPRSAATKKKVTKKKTAPRTTTARK